MALRYHYPQGVLQAFRVRKAGTSLVETLVSMTLLGVIFIPMLFLSSAFFLAHLAKARQNVDVSVNAARFSNQFMEELYRTQRVLPDSNDTEIHFSYYDGIRQEAIIRGYRLTTSGSYQILEKLTYDPAANTWTAISPYGTVQADQVLLPTTSVFAYCDSAGCGANPEQALFVQLSGWEFMPAKNTNRKVDFPDMDVYLSAGASSSDIMLSNAPQELYSFASSTSFGTGANLNLVHINPNGRMFNYANITSGGGAGTLTTIMTDAAPRWSSRVNSNGMVFSAEDSNRFMAWHKDTGLSTIVNTAESDTPGEGNWGYTERAEIYFGGGNRVFFAERDDVKIWTWEPSAGLSTIITLASGIAPDANMAANSNNQFVFGNGAGEGNMLFWQPSTGLSTLLPVDFSSGNTVGQGSTAIGSDGRVFFGGYWPSNSEFWSWKADTGLSTIITNGNESGRHNVHVAPDSRVFFGDSIGTAYWTWKADTGLSTIATTAQLNSMGHDGGRESSALTADGSRIYFGGRSTDIFLTWSEATKLSTVVIGETNPGYHTIIVSPLDGRVYFAKDSGSGEVWTWHPSTKLSTIMPSGDHPAFWNRAVASDGRVFFGEEDNGGTKFWTWHTDTKLSTIVTGEAAPGSEMALSVDGRGRVFFGESTGAAANNSFWIWNKDTGLTTLMNNQHDPGYRASVHGLPGDGGAVFATASNGNSLLHWSPDPPQASLPRVTNMGSRTNQTLSVTLPSGTPYYNASTQTHDGEMYISDYSAKTIDRYTYSGSSFSRSTQFNWAANTGAVGAVAVDQNKTGIALLDTANKQIDYYSNRKGTGSPTAANQYALTGTTTPTGLAVSGRTGNYLVLDSAQQGSNPDKYVRLFVYNDTGTQITNSPWKIYIDDEVGTDYPLSVDATGETAFKIQYDDEKNILYLIAPTVGRVYALMLPEPL